MNGLTADGVHAHLRAGVAAMQRRDARAAARDFGAVTSANPAIAPAWLLLAQAHRMLRDVGAEQAALDRLLALDPDHVRGLLMKGDRAMADDDRRAATAFYAKAVQCGERQASVPETLAADLGRARAILADNAARYADHIDRVLDPDTTPERVQEAIAIATGRATLHLQQPTSFHLPGLAQRAFFDRREFPWVAAVEAAAPTIRAELLAAMADAEGAAGFAPYLVADGARPQHAHALLGNADWSALYLHRDGAVAADAVARFPATLAALSHAPMPVVRARSPMALFSRLAPGTHIPPHHGMLNTRLICHLPLIVPDGCRLRVGNHVRAWRRDELLIFDDSIEHEAWNDSAETRVVLLFEVWRPELDADERAALTTLYEAVGSYAE